MKCVQHQKTQEIIRVDDKEADKLVASKEYGYTSKSIWKAQEAKKKALAEAAKSPPKKEGLQPIQEVLEANASKEKKRIVKKNAEKKKKKDEAA